MINLQLDGLVQESNSSTATCSDLIAFGNSKKFRFPFSI